jgi:hypothetical protein
MRRALALLAGLALAMAFAAPAAAATPTATVHPAYTSHCGEPPVPDTPINDGPDGIFGTPCAHHDTCYFGRSGLDRAGCDWRFFNEMVAACINHYAWWDPRRAWCVDLASGYYAAVRVFGRFYWWGPPNKNN